MTAGRLIAAVSVAEIFSMAGVSSFPALITTFIADWRLTNTEAGWLGGIYLAGYLAAVPLLSSLTDRRDPRVIYIVGAAVSFTAMAAFAAAADGFWSALVLRLAYGAGIAGTFMPGLKILTDRIEGPAQSRAVAIYLSCFSVGAALSFLIAGEAHHWLGWRGAFAVAAGGSLVALAIIAVAVRPAGEREAAPPETPLLDFRPVFANRRAMAWVLSYGAHMWELYGQRTWIVAFLLFCESLRPGGGEWLVSATVIAAAVNLIAAPASFLGNELALRFGRRRFVVAAALACAGLSAAIGFLAQLPYGVIVVLFTLNGFLAYVDSSAITGGTVAAAAPRYGGATMAVHTFVGFGAALMGPLVFGVVLDAAGADTVLGWGLAFASLGLAALGAPLALALLIRGAR